MQRAHTLQRSHIRLDLKPHFLHILPIFIHFLKAVGSAVPFCANTLGLISFRPENISKVPRFFYNVSDSKYETKGLAVLRHVCVYQDRELLWPGDIGV